MHSRKAATALALGALVALAPSAIAGNPLRGSTTTDGGYHTWDSDMVDLEKQGRTGAGVFVAVLDTGLVANWKDYFPAERVAEDLGKGFHQNVSFKAHGSDPCRLDAYVERNLRETTFIGSRGSSHGTHVASTVIGYAYDANPDTAQGFSLPPIQVRGIAPDATIIPVKVLSDYQVPSLPGCEDEDVATGLQVFGTERMVAAGIEYVARLKETVLRDSPVVINMSLGADPGDPISVVEKAAVDRAIAAGVVVVAAAGNDGEAGMSAPGSYGPVISAGASGWTREWVDPVSRELPDGVARYRMWWLKNVLGPGAGTPGELEPPLWDGSGDVDEDDASEVYMADFSSRSKSPSQDLDVVAPGSWVRGPFAGTPGYVHLPWWSKGISDLVGSRNPGNFFYVGGTSMASPHVASIAALMLEADPSLTGPQVESILESTALDLTAGSAQVWNPFRVDATGAPLPAAFETVSWGADAVGSGLVQADAAVDAAE